MTLSLLIASPSQTAIYKAVVIVEDRVYDPVSKMMTDDWRETDRFELLPGQCYETYLTSTRRWRVEEEPLPPPSLTGNAQSGEENNPSNLVTLNETAHGHD